MKAKPFVLLAGTSGTGKTRIARLFAEAVGATSAADNGNGRYLQVAVQPNWADSSDLLGYFNLQGKFVEGRVFEFLVRAKDDRTRPYFLCLDEMNLDRASTIEFSDVNMRAGLKEANTVADAKPIALGNSFFRTDYLTLKECLAQQDDIGRALIEDICTELEELNGILAAANAQVGYRVRDEAVFYMMAAREPYGDLPEADRKKASECIKIKCQ